MDVITLKMFALLMCKGTVNEKANVFFDIVIGMEKVKQNDEEASIAWNASRLVTGFKKLIFFSEIFPKKYQNEFMEELLALQQQNIKNKHSMAKKNPDNLNYNYGNQEEIQSPSPKKGTHRGSKDIETTPKTAKHGHTPKKVLTAAQIERNKLLWSDEYLLYIEENFESIFKGMYDEMFVDQIFVSHDCRVYKDDFVLAIAGNPMSTDAEEPKIDWLFKPTKIRELFHSKIDWD